MSRNPHESLDPTRAPSSPNLLPISINMIFISVLQIIRTLDDEMTGIGSFPTNCVCSVSTNRYRLWSPDTSKWMTYCIPCVSCTDTGLILPDTYQESIRRLNFIFFKNNYPILFRYIWDTSDRRWKTDMCRLPDVSIIFGIYVID